MPYNYFCCRKHVPPVKASVMQLAAMPGAYACPPCPTCGKTMEFYDAGTEQVDRRPVPPRLPNAVPSPTMSGEIDVYSDSGHNPGHGDVTWTITRNPLKFVMTIKIMLGVGVAGNYDSTQIFKLTDGLLKIPQAGDKADWWLKAPYSIPGADKKVWHSINLSGLIDPPTHNLPNTIEIGVKLGDATFGLIHLLAGHGKAVRNIGPVSLYVPSGDEAFSALLSLQTGMRRFVEHDTIRQIFRDVAKDKLLIVGSHSGMIVLTRAPGDRRYSVTTLYNTQNPQFGTKIYDNDVRNRRLTS